MSINFILAVLGVCSLFLPGGVSDVILVNIEGRETSLLVEDVFNGRGEEILEGKEVSILQVSDFPGHNPDQKIIIGDDQNWIANIADGVVVLIQWSGMDAQFFYLDPIAGICEEFLWSSVVSPGEDVYFIVFQRGKVSTFGVHVQSYASVG